MWSQGMPMGHLSYGHINLIYLILTYFQDMWVGLVGSYPEVGHMPRGGGIHGALNTT